MALGNCPDCGQAISNAAAFCPNCGHPGRNDHAVSVAVRDIEMGFGSMVIFMVKAAIAALPALLFLSLLGFLAFGILGAMFGRY